MSKPTAIPKGSGSRSSSPMPRDRGIERMPTSPVAMRTDRDAPPRDGTGRERTPEAHKDKDAKIRDLKITASIPAIATPPRELAVRPTPSPGSPFMPERKTTRSESSAPALPNRPQSPAQLSTSIAKEAAAIVGARKADGGFDDSARRRSRDDGALSKKEEKPEEKKEKEKKKEHKDKEHKDKEKKEKDKKHSLNAVPSTEEKPELSERHERKHSEPARPSPALLSPETRRLRAEEEKTRSNSTAGREKEAMKLPLPVGDPLRRHTNERSPGSNQGTPTSTEKKMPSLVIPKTEPPAPNISPKQAVVPTSASTSALAVQSAPIGRRKGTNNMGSIDMRTATMSDTAISTPVNVGTMTPRGITSTPASSLPPLELVPSTPKLFPWLLFIADSADTTPIQGTATDFVAKSLMGEFLNVCSKKIADNMSLSLDVQFLLSDVFDFQNDPTFCALIGGLHELSKKHLSQVVRTLMTWKTRQITEVEKLKVRLQKDAKTGMSVKEGLVLLEERHQLCVDYTFLSTLQSLFKFALPAYKSALEDSVVDQLGDWVFDNLRPTDKKTDPQQSRALLTNRKSIPDLWSAILGYLTRERMHIMASKFFKEMVYTNDRARAKATAVLIGARTVKLKLRSKSSLQRSVAFLEKYDQVMTEAKKKKDDIVTCLTETLTAILANSCNTPQKEGIDYSPMNALITKMYPTYLERAKKRDKNVLLYHPLCTMLLCVADNYFFKDNWWTFLESVLLSPKYLKEKSFRGVHFECVRPLIENYFTRNSDPPEALSRLQFISATMYPPTSRKLVTPGTTETLGTFIDLIVAVASAKMDFAVANIITELIRGPEMAPEKLYVGLRAFLRINTPAKPPDTPADALALEKSRKYKRPELNPDKAVVHFPKIATHLLQALLSLDPLFGWLQINQQKTLNELMAKEKVHPPQLCLDTIRVAIACIPIAMNQMFPPELLTLLCRYLVHLDKPIQEAAYKTLYTLMVQRSDLRAPIAAALADFSFSIPDKQHELIYTVLHKLALLLKEWETRITTGKEEVREPAKALPLQIVIKLEAVALVFLCAPFSNIRLNALDCLASVAAIVARFGEDADVPTQRVHDIITEASPDVVQRLHQDYLFRLKNPIINPVENSMDKIVSSETNGGQLCWSFCFADLLKQIITLCPDPVRQAWALVLNRIPAVQPTESDSLRFGAQTETIEEEVGLQYWSNYILFACAASQHIDEQRKGSSPSVLGVSETLRALSAKHAPAPLDIQPAMNARQLLEQVSAALKTDHNDAVVMALSRTNASLYDMLFQVLQPLEKEYQTKKGTKRDRLRIDISSVYAYVGESMKPGTLANREGLRKIFLAHISDIMTFFGRPENETIGDSNQFLRYNFCVTVKCVAQDLRGQEDRITKALRKQAFTFLLRWTTGEALLQEEGTKRIAQAMLSQIRDAEAKQDYERKLKESVLVLQFSSASAISALLLGPSWDDAANKSDGPVFSWVDRMLEQHQKNVFFSSLSIASSAVESFLSANPQRDTLLNAVINRCYSSSVMIAKGYFNALVELYKGQDFSCPLYVLLALILFKCINAEQTVRKSAIQLLQLLWIQTQGSGADGKAPASKWSPGDAEACMDSHLPHTYYNAQYVLSGRLAQLQPKLCHDLFIHVVMRLEEMAPKDQAPMLRALLPWIKQMDFRHYVVQHDYVLLNLTVLTLKYDVTHPANVRDLWGTFAAEESNVAAIVDFLLKIGDKKRNNDLMTVAKQIILLVARGQPQATVDALVNELSSLKKRNTSRTSLVNPEQKQVLSASTEVERQYAYSSFNILLPDTVNYVPPGRGHLSLILLSELAFEQAAHFKPHLPVVLHQVFLGLDFSLQSFVIEHCRILLLNLVNALGIKPSELQNSGSDESAAELVEFLRTKENKQLWAHEDVTLKKPTIVSAAELRKLVQRVVRCLGAGNKQLTEEWAAEALTWAVSCPSAHLQNRSHQIYRALQPSVSREALDELLSSMARCIAAHTPESNALLIEILSTLRCIVEPLDSNRLMLFTNLFWATVAILHTDYEEIYCQALLLLNQLTERLNWFDRSVQNIFVASTPKEWKPPFIGLQPMVMKGLLSTTGHPTAVELLARFTLLPCHHVFQADNSRLMLNVLCLLPDILTAPPDRASKWTDALAQAAEKDGRELLSKILHHFSPTANWLQDLMREYAMQYFPQQTLVTFKCLFRFLTKGPPAYQQASLQIIRALLRAADSVVFDILKPRTTVWYGILLQQLNGPHWREVVNILDVSVSRVPASPVTLEPKDLMTFSTFTHNPEWLNVPSDGTQQASGNLAPVLEGAELHKSEYAVAPEFFAKFFSSADVNALEAAGRSPDASLRNTGASDETDSQVGSLRSNPGAPPGPEKGGAATAAAGAREEIVLGGDKGPGGFPVFTGFDDFLESLDNLPSNTGPASPKAAPVPAVAPDAAEPEYGRSSSFSTLIFKHAQRGKPTKFGSKLPLQKEAADLAMQWAESVNQTSFSNPSDMFKIFPEATWLLNALREDFVASLAGFQKEVQGEENAKLLNNPILKLAKMETLFKLPIPETSKVILNIIATKYRARLQADSSFERTLKEQRSRLLQSLNGQYLSYIEQKIAIEDMRGTVQGPEQSKEWISAVLALHQQLVSMFQTNISLQALITDLLASEPGDTAEEEAQKKVVEEELRANAALAEKIKPAKKRSQRKGKKAKKDKKEKNTAGLSAPDDDDGEKVIIAD